MQPDLSLENFLLTVIIMLTWLLVPVTFTESLSYIRS